MATDSIDLVREFQTAFGQPIADQPNIRDHNLNRLRLNLLREELDELWVALETGDPVATLDALCDLEYVLMGAWLSLGFAGYREAGMAAVHASNMSKLGADGKPVLRADGKVTKGPAFKPPDLVSILNPPAEDFDDSITGEWSRPPLTPLPATWAGELGEEPIEIAIVRTDSSEFENTMDAPCEDCAAPPKAHHRAGCPFTVLVPGAEGAI